MPFLHGMTFTTTTRMAVLPAVLNVGGAINFNINRNVGIEVLYNHVSSSSGVYNYGL